MTETEFLNEELRQQELKEDRELQQHQHQLMIHDYFCHDCNEYHDLPEDFDGNKIIECLKCGSENIETNLI